MYITKVAPLLEIVHFLFTIFHASLGNLRWVNAFSHKLEAGPVAL